MDVSKGRIGQFFLFIGLILLAIFFTIDKSQAPQAGLFLGGLALFLFGGFLMVRDYKPPAESARFRSWRKMNQKQKAMKAASKSKKGKPDQEG